MGNDRLMNELSSRGLDNLLDRYFELNHVPAAQQKSIRALGGLRELLDPKSTLTPVQRLQRVREAAQNVDVIIAGSTDPQRLVELSSVMIDNAVNGEVNTLEYWGENPATEQRLRPVAQAVYKLLGAASKLADEQANALATQIKRGDDPRADQWEKLDNLARNAKYNQHMAAYFLAMSLDPADPERKSLPDKTIKALGDFDTPDSNVQARVRNMIGKLNLAKGSYKEAHRVYASVANDKGQIKPPPNPFEQYEARYFSVVVDLMGKDLQAAKQDFSVLQQWQTATLPKLVATLKLDPKEKETSEKGISAAAQMLEYRIDALQSDLAQAPDEKKKADSAAEAVLMQLRKDRPDMARVIDDQLASRMPIDRPVSQLNTLLLEGLLSKGMIEYRKPEDQKPNQEAMQRGIEGAGELLSRRGRDKSITPQMVAEASVVIPSLQDRLGHPMDAVAGYLDYAKNFYASDLKLATQVLDRAGFLVFQMKKKPPVPPGFTELYGRFLETAIGLPFNHTELNYAMGDHLQSMGQPKEAFPFFQRVPKNDANYLNAQYKSMLCLRDLLDAHTTPAEHKLYVEELVKAAGIVKQLGAASSNEVDRSKAVQSTLVYARLARTEQQDPKTSLKTLENFDAMVKGLPGEKALESEALFERIESYMALGQFDKATGDLVSLLNKTEGSEGIGLVRQLLEQLDKEYVKADVDHDVKTMRTVARNEAQLTGFLGEWAKNNPDPNISKFYYAYVVYDARTKRLAGTLTEDPAERTKLLNETLKVYQNLQTPQMHALYVKTLDPKKVESGDIDPKQPDPSVQTGLALTDFELGNYKDAQALLGDLIGSQKLGPPAVVESTPDGITTRVNDLYWECTYKLLKSDAELAKAKNDKEHQDMMTNTKRGLKNILIRGGIPERWEDEFEGLRKELIPDFAVGAPAATPSTPPIKASQRVSQK